MVHTEGVDAMTMNEMSIWLRAPRHSKPHLEITATVDRDGVDLLIKILQKFKDVLGLLDEREIEGDKDNEQG